MNDLHAGYAQLMRAFLSGEVPAAQFAHDYLQKFKGETRPMNERTYQLLDALFGDVDAFCEDESLNEQLSSERPGYYLNEAQLREHVNKAAACLQSESRQ